MSESLKVRWLGRVPYSEGLERQERAVLQRRDDEIQDELWLLEHPPVVTLGRSSHQENLLLNRDALAERGIELYESGRGGDVTYHGPGQLVGYPILALTGTDRDAHLYLRNIEEALIQLAADFGIEANRVEGLTGIWVGNEKLAAIGVRLNRGWITSHGFALNVTTDLTGFETIIPCGIQDRGVTSLQRLLGRDLELRDVAERMSAAFGKAFGRSVSAL